MYYLSQLFWCISVMNKYMAINVHTIYQGCPYFDVLPCLMSPVQF